MLRLRPLLRLNVHPALRPDLDGRAGQLGWDAAVRPTDIQAPGLGAMVWRAKLPRLDGNEAEVRRRAALKMVHFYLLPKRGIFLANPTKNSFGNNKKYLPHPNSSANQ